MSNHIDRAAKAIADFNACGHCEGTCGTCRGEAEALADADLLATPEHDARVINKFLLRWADRQDGDPYNDEHCDEWERGGKAMLRSILRYADSIEREGGAGMRDAEEVAREVWCEVTWNAAEDWTCHTHETAWREEDAWCPVAAEVIRARDAEVRAATLAEFTEERTDRIIASRVPCDCHGDWQHHARLVGDDSPATHVRHDFVPSRRLVGPWEPDTRTPEQGSTG